MKKNEKSELLNHEKILQKKETGRENNGERGNKGSKCRIQKLKIAHSNKS